MSTFRLMFLLIAWACLARCTSAADRWPEWRGATGQGISTAKNVPVSWNETKNIAWKTVIPGHGWSTAVIENGQVWLTTAKDKPAREEDAKRRMKTSTNSQPLTISEWVSLRAVCVDLESGQLLYDVELLTERDPQMIHHENSYATPTPIIEDGRLYCHYGPYGIACLDTKMGKVLWSNRTLRVKHENGPGSSPVLWNNLLFVHCDGIDQQYIVALHKQTGEIEWKVARSGQMHKDPQMRKSYATPLVVDIQGHPQLISPAADWVYGYAPENGHELWRIPYGELGFSNAPRPVADNSLIYIATGYMQARLLAIRVNQRNGQSDPVIKWTYKKQVPNVSSPLLVGDEIYFVSDKGIASCLDARNGKLYWRNRIGKHFWASPLYAEGRIYFFDRDGTTTVIAADTEFRKLSQNKLDGTLLASAAVVDNALILRTDKALYRIK